MDNEKGEEKHYNINDVDGFWENIMEMSLEEFDEAVEIYRAIDDVILGKRK